MDKSDRLDKGSTAEVRSSGAVQVENMLLVDSQVTRNQLTPPSVKKNTETYCEFVNKPPISFGIKLNIMELILTGINGRCFDRVKSRPGTYVLVLQHMLVIVIPIIIMRRASLCRPQYFIILVRIQISFVSRGGRQQRSS